MKAAPDYRARTDHACRGRTISGPARRRGDRDGRNRLSVRIGHPVFQRAAAALSADAGPLAPRDHRPGDVERQPVVSRRRPGAGDAARSARLRRTAAASGTTGSCAVDDALSNEAAVISQPMATVLSALNAVPNVIGLTVAVVGQGPIGQLFNACLSSAGAARVIGIDAREARVARSCEFGATDVVVVSPDDEGGWCVRTRAGDDRRHDGRPRRRGRRPRGTAVQPRHCALARNQGRVLYFGIPPDRLDGIAFEPVVRKSLTIHTSVPDDLRPFVTIAMRAIQQGRINPDRLITHRFAFVDLQEAFETYRDRAGMKVILNFERLQARIQMPACSFAGICRGSGRRRSSRSRRSRTRTGRRSRATTPASGTAALTQMTPEERRGPRAAVDVSDRRARLSNT